jgi:HPt (histidine-containing phosphotransfer) domain-containing protein
MTREVIALFLADTPPRLEAIANALAARDADALALAAHALKGSAANVGAVAMQREAASLEALAREGLSPDAAQRHRTLCEAWDATRSALARWP